MTVGQRVVWTERGVADTEAFERPSPGAGQLEVTTQLSMISRGTERAFLLALPNTPGTFPHYPGYSVVGTVSRIGPEVKAFQPGDRVVCAGRHQSHVVVGAADCLPVPEHVSSEQAVSFQIIAMVSQGLRKLHLEIGESVAVLGAGLLGCLAVRMFRIMGALPVISVVRRPERAVMARAAGADGVCWGLDDLRAWMTKFSGDDGACLSIDATDDPAMFSLACAVVRPRGRVLLLGGARGVAQNVNYYRDIHKKGLTVIGAHSSVAPRFDSSSGYWTRAEEQRLALRMLAAGRLAVADFATHRFEWSRAKEAYRAICQADFLGLGCLLQWTDDRADGADR